MTNHEPKKQMNFMKKFFKKHHQTQTTHNEADIDEVENRFLDYYTSFMQHHPDIIIMFSLQGDVIYHNKDLFKYLGFHFTKNMKYKDVFSDATYTMLQVAFQEAKNGKPKRIHVSTFNKQSEQLYLETTFIPVQTTTGQVESVFLDIRDITHEKQLEKKLNKKNTRSWHLIKIMSKYMIT